MKTSSLHGEQDAGTPSSTSQKPPGHRDPATRHKGWLNSASANQGIKGRMAKRARNHLPRESRRRRRADRLTEEMCGLKLSGPSFLTPGQPLATTDIVPAHSCSLSL